MLEKFRCWKLWNKVLFTYRYKWYTQLTINLYFAVCLQQISKSWQHQDYFWKDNQHLTKRI